MSPRTTVIPVNTIADQFGEGIAIERISLKDLFSGETTPGEFETARQAHREDRHSFFLLEKGTIRIEIDFQQHEFRRHTLVYLHPNQVHRIIAFNNVTVSTLAMSNEGLNREYLAWLEGHTPVEPVVLSRDTFAIMTDAISLCLKLAGRRGDKLHRSLMRDSCNALAALMVSQFAARSIPADPSSRAETVGNAFTQLLEQHYTQTKRPAAYAGMLNISTAYLNQCVKQASGQSVSHHIRQRIILEAKRLLTYSDKSVKEIAAALGYDDYPYFSRLFTTVTGMSALRFRNKNRD